MRGGKCLGNGIGGSLTYVSISSVPCRTIGSSDRDKCLAAEGVDIRDLMVGYTPHRIFKVGGSWGSMTSYHTNIWQLVLQEYLRLG